MEKVRFIVAEVTREDLKSQGYEFDLSDEVMENVANEMMEAITSCDYWTALDCACFTCGIKKISNK